MNINTEVAALTPKFHKLVAKAESLGGTVKLSYDVTENEINIRAQVKWGMYWALLAAVWMTKSTMQENLEVCECEFNRLKATKRNQHFYVEPNPFTVNERLEEFFRLNGLDVATVSWKTAASSLSVQTFVVIDATLPEVKNIIEDQLVEVKHRPEYQDRAFVKIPEGRLCIRQPQGAQHCEIYFHDIQG